MPYDTNTNRLIIENNIEWNISLIDLLSKEMHQQAQYKGSKINFASRINFNQKKYLTNDSKEEEDKEKEKFMFFDSSDNYIKKYSIC